MTVFDYLSASALSLVVSGNTGISPFFSLFIVGVCEKMDPDLLNMSENMEAILSSWPALCFLAIMTVLEFLAKCIPVIDEVVDSAMVFVVPFISVLGSLSTFGVFQMYQNLDDVDMSNVEVNDYNDAERFLQDESGRTVSESALMVFQGLLIAAGVVLALLIHLFKMIVRLLGEGCLTNFITIMETSWIACTITMAIYIRPIAVGIAILLGLAAAYSFKKNVYDKRFKTSEDESSSTTREVPLATIAPKDNENMSSDPEGSSPGTSYVAMKNEK